MVFINARIVLRHVEEIDASRVRLPATEDNPMIASAFIAFTDGHSLVEKRISGGILVLIFVETFPAYITDVRCGLVHTVRECCSIIKHFETHKSINILNISSYIYMGDIMDDDYVTKRDLVSTLLLSCSLGQSIPKAKEYVLSELVNGTIEHAGGDAGLLAYSEMRSDPRYEEIMYDYLEEEIRHAEQDISPNIESAILDLCAPYMTHDPPERPCMRTELYDILDVPGWPVGTMRTYDGHAYMFTTGVLECKDKLMGRFSASERDDIEGIANSMRKYLDHDIDFIREMIHR